MDGVMRIGELSRRTGVKPELLRAWEQRYGLLQPTRSPGGFRLYSPADEERVRRTSALIADGLSAAEAARAAVATPTESTAPEVRPLVDDLADDLRQALDSFDAMAGHAALDRLFAAVSVELAITDVLIPYLHDLGARWESGAVTVAQEHFASNLIRGRLLGLARDWGSGGSESAVLACPPGEAHDIGLILFGLLIARRGWRITFLGADTPFDTLDASRRTLRPSLVVLATCDAELFRRHTESIAGLAATTAVAVMAPVEEQVVSGTGARALANDIPTAAASIGR